MLAFERHGRGEPLVLVHGVAHRRQAWYPVLERLTPYREVILVDLPGHGESPDFDPAGRPIAEALREQFRAFLDEQGLVRPHVAGNSLGGRIALEAAAVGDARTATALSPAGFWRSSAEFGYSRLLFTTMAATADRLGPRAGALSRRRSGRWLSYAWIVAHPDKLTPEQALGDLRAFERARPALREILAAATPFELPIPMDVPVTVAWGSRDLLLPRWQAGVARRQLPGATHLIIPGAGHVPMTDDPETVARILLAGSTGGTVERAPVASSAHPDLAASA